MSKRQQLIWETHKRLGLSVMEVYRIHKIADKRGRRK